MSCQKWITAAAIGAAVSVGMPRSAKADNINWTGLGDGVSWSDVNNWLNTTTNEPQVPGVADVAFINGVANVNLDTSVSFGSFAIGHNSGVARLDIGPGMNMTLNNTSRIGRGTDAVGNARGEVWQTGGTVHFGGGNRRLGLSYDSRPVGEVNADSLYVISGGTLTFEGSGSIQIGRTFDSNALPTSFGRAEFRVVGTGPSLIHIGTGAGGDLVMQPGGTTGDPVLHFVIDAGGVTPITVGDELRLEEGAKLEISVMSQTVPTGDITLVIADRLTGSAEIFDGLPEGAEISSIFSNRLYEWNVGYQDGSDDGILDAWVRLTNPRSFRGGDANKDGVVNLADFNILAGNFGTSGASWLTADFNGDGLVNLADFNILAANFGLSGLTSDPTPDDWSALAAAVPEPSALGLIGLAAAGVLRRRRN